jgi:TLC domain
MPLCHLSFLLHPLTTMLQQVWEVYNSEESFLIFWLFLFFWVAAYFYGKANGQEFHDWLFLHNVHNLTAIVVGGACLCIADEKVFDEKYLIFFSLSYFLMDLVDCMIRMDYAYTAHAFFCVALSLGNYSIPTCRTLRTHSMASLIELSSPFFHVAKTTKKPLHFLLFALVFTVCRIIWVPVIMKRVHDGGVIFPYDPVQILLSGFYLLNCFWYFKIIRILVGGGGNKKKGDAEKKGD